MVSYPYTKLMTAIMDVDMAAALVLASAAKADALGVPEERRVYLRGWGYAEDPEHVAGHPELWRSPAMAAAARPPWRGPASAPTTSRTSTSTRVSRARSASLSTRSGSPRTTRGAVTRTGGLPYHGGPGSNYMTHSLAAMAETLRPGPRLLRLVSGVGMHMQKHAYGVWSTRRP